MLKRPYLCPRYPEYNLFTLKGLIPNKLPLAVKQGAFFYLIPFSLSAFVYFAAFFKCSEYVLAKLWVPEKSSLAHI